jgi:hypothetical protein
MKTKINHLLCGLRSAFAAPARTLIIGLAAFLAVPCKAAPPNSAGGTGGGTIYYVGPWPGTTQGGTAVMTTMNSDGSGKTALGLGMFGNPSTVLYNNRRWFIYTHVIPDQYYPDGTRRAEVFALRDDFEPTLNNNADTMVQLTDDITLQPKGGSTDWVPGGAQISFKGRRWSSVDQGATVAEGGIYTASLAFDAAGNIVGLAAQPAAPAIPFPLVETTPGGPWPAMADNFCWNPTGDVVVYANVARNELWLADLLNVHIRVYFGGGADMPQWSPDTSTIGFRGGSGVCTIKPDGSNFKVIVPNTSTWVYSGPYFSPTGSHIVYDGCHQASSNFDVFRATVKGASRVNLTNTSSPRNEYTRPGSGAGWR